MYSFRQPQPRLKVSPRIPTLVSYQIPRKKPKNKVQKTKNKKDPSIGNCNE